MTTLVTGGAGYIGAHTVRALRAAGREVVVLDTLERGNRAAVIDAPLVVGDIADRQIVAEVCQKYGVKAVIHFAAYKAVGESMSQPMKYWRNNVASTISLLETLLEQHVSQFVFSSTAGVYGTPKFSPVTELMPTNPESTYAITKLAVEQLLNAVAPNAMRSVCLRYFNAAGASSDSRIGEDWTTSQNLIPRAMRAMLDPDFKFEVFGNDYPTADGTCIRDYIHVEDLAQAHVKALDYLSMGGDSIVCNVGTGQGTSVLEILKMTQVVAQRPVPHTVGPKRQGDPVSVFADASLANKVLNWRPTHDLQSIIESAYNWHSLHPNGFR